VAYVTFKQRKQAEEAREHMNQGWIDGVVVCCTLPLAAVPVQFALLCGGHGIRYMGLVENMLVIAAGDCRVCPCTSSGAETVAAQADVAATGRAAQAHIPVRGTPAGKALSLPRIQAEI
jgi:hypothetical protein